MKFLRLLAVFTRIGMLSDLAYRANFWFQVLESLLSVATALGAVAVVFSKTEDLGGWRSEELVALVGIYFMVLGMINVVIAPSLQKFMEQVQQNHPLFEREALAPIIESEVRDGYLGGQNAVLQFSPYYLQQKPLALSAFTPTRISQTMQRRSTLGLSEQRPFESTSGSIGSTRRVK